MISNRYLPWTPAACLSGPLLLLCSLFGAWAAMPPPVIQEIRLVNGVPHLTIASLAGQTNTILYTPELVPANWQALTNLVVAESPYVVVEGSAAAGSMRFYEVAVVAGGAGPSGPTNLVWIPPGTFTMGSPSTETDRLVREGPQTQVTISQGFWMGRHEVTQREYQTVMESNPSYFPEDLDQPVEQVTWSNATNYCSKLTAQARVQGQLPTGYVYRLPTEAEWEYACRAGTTTATAFGDSLSSTQANFRGNYPYNGAEKGPYLGRPTRVGSYPGNAWGLYDMHGNVWEWCLDWYASSYSGGSVTDPMGPTWGSYRVLRGGGWINDGAKCRSAERGYDYPSYKGGYTGFRVVLAPELPWNP